MYTGNGIEWSIQDVDLTGATIDASLSTSIALDSNLTPHIAYVDKENGNWVLKYASWAGSAWNIQTVDQTGKLDIIVTLALDSVNNPHIAYSDSSKIPQTNQYDSDQAYLKYATWENSSWNIQTLETNGIPQSAAIALDSHGNPHVAYYFMYLKEYDGTMTRYEWDLKYASLGLPTANPLTSEPVFSIVIVVAVAGVVLAVLLLRKKRQFQKFKINKTVDVSENK
jgi:hypothetical protein